MAGDAADQADITEVHVLYATGSKRRDWELFRTCFTDDCDADYGEVGHWHGVDAITAFMTDVHAPMGHTLHRLSNFAITVDGDNASARTYVDVVLMIDGTTTINALGFYDDELVRREAGWRIARRRFTGVQQRVVDAR